MTLYELGQLVSYARCAAAFLKMPSEIKIICQKGAGSWDTNPWVWVIEFKRAA